MRHLFTKLVMLSSMSALAMTAFGDTVITSVPFTITKHGTYVFRANLTLSGTGQTAITINASNVVIDLQSFTLDTSDATASNTGISVSTNSSFVTIQNGSINNYGAGINLFGPEETVQNVRLESVGNGMNVYNTCTSSLIQNCFIAGNGQNVGVHLDGCADVVMKNNLIVSENTGILSAGNNSFIYNCVGSCGVCFNLGSTDKYQGNLTTLCTTSFSGGIAVGDENN